MSPEVEIDPLIVAVAEARRLAAGGDVAGGLACLQTAHRAAAAHSDCDVECDSLWEAALEEFSAQWSGGSPR